MRWHRSCFRLYWRWKSRRRVGRPAVPADIRDLVRTISRENPVATENLIRAGADAAMGYPRFGMIDFLKLLGGLLVGLFRSRAAREAEMAFLRQQLVVLQRSAPARLRLRTADRLIFVWLYRLFPSLLEAAVIFKPETLVRWHRSGFRLYWRWKSRRRVGRPAVPADIRDLIRTMSRDNPLWGAPRIHGELLKLGIDIAQSTVAKYMSTASRPTLTGLAGFPAQSHRPHRRGRSVRRSDDRVQTALRAGHPASGAATARLRPM